MENPISYARAVFRTDPEFAKTALSLDMLVGTICAFAVFLILNMVEFSATVAALTIFNVTCTIITVIFGAFAWYNRKMVQRIRSDEDGWLDFEGEDY